MAERHMKAFPKIVLVAVVAFLLFKGLQVAMNRGIIPTVGIMKAIVPKRADLPNIQDAKLANVKPINFPTDQPAADVSAQPMRVEEWAWNAQTSLNYANGGPLTTQGSLMAKQGVSLLINRQDDTGQMKANLLNCAKQLAAGASNCTAGDNFVLIMGDQSGAFFAEINPQLKKLGPYYAEVVGITGRSNGEDKLMGPEIWKYNPQAAKGSLIAASVTEGDWNVAMKWAGDNGLKNNPDPTTWDPDAVNWAEADDYEKAAEKYIANYCEDRKVMKDGHLTGETKHVCVNAVATWTPADVNVAKQRGGLISVVSTRQYKAQMPDVVIGIHKFDQDNRKQVVGMLVATFQASDQINAFADAKKHACDVNAVIYHEEDGAYWCKYFDGVTEPDKVGGMVDLGGSKVSNLADNLVWFGLQPGTPNYFAITYRTFGEIAVQQYPKRVPTIPALDEVLDTSYVAQAKQVMGTDTAAPDVPVYRASATTGTVVSRKNWSVEFNSAQATLTPDGLDTMQKIKDDLAVASGLTVVLNGYTDNTGSHEFNNQLSKMRAQSVETWLHKTAPQAFPLERFKVNAYGDQTPVASNATPDGRAKNRRVQIVLANSNE